jgi:glycosyltransferase involved in cell wall biosynthesis
VLSLGRRNQKYKNVELMVRLAPLLDTMGLDLWMPGDVDEAFIAALVSPRPSNLKLLGRIGDDDLKKALSGALCYLFPSRIEGFGLPAVEAMASGCPVIASTSPCLPQVCGEAALYAGPDDLEGWADAMRRVRDDAALRDSLVEAGHARAKGYSWRKIAETYLELMMQVDMTMPAARPS